MENKISIVLFFMALVMIIETSTGTSPPPPPTSFTCLAELMTCQGATTPSPACCTTLKIVYDTEKDCLCLVVMSENVTSLLGMNSTQVSGLLVKCKIVDSSTTICTSPFAAPPLFPFTPLGPLPFLTPPGLLLPSPPPPSEASVLCSATWMRLSGLASLFLFVFFGWYQ